MHQVEAGGGREAEGPDRRVSLTPAADHASAHASTWMHARVHGAHAGIPVRRMDACGSAWRPCRHAPITLPPPITHMRSGPPTMSPPRPWRPDGRMRVELLRGLGSCFDVTVMVRQQRQGGAVRLRLRRIPSEKCRAAGSGYALATSSDAMP